MRTILLVISVGLVAPTVNQPPQPASENVKLWAGLSVTSPVVDADQVSDTRSFMVSFALVNDSDQPFAPTEVVDHSTLLVNGKALKDWPMIIGNGPREVPGSKLLKGQSLRFTKGMGRNIVEPGVYKLQWKGAGFESAEVTFRVQGKKAQ
jgi:hypothetical protein